MPRLLLISLLLLSATLRAATLRAYVEPATAQTNQVVTYIITVSNGTLQSIPQLRLPSQIGMNSGHQLSQRIEIVNGQRTMSVRIAWQIAGTEPGEYTIPPQELMVDGQMQKTNEVKLTVTEGPATPAAAAGDELTTPLFQIEVGKTEMYQGEVVPITASLFFPRRVNPRRIGLIDVNKTDFAVARFPQQSEQTETVINGTEYLVYSFRSVLTPLHAGDLKVGPASVELLYEVMDTRQRMPNLPFGMMMGMGEQKKQTVRSQDVKVRVLPLPAEGKPANFTGAVGEFAISSTATPTALAVGDPLAAEVYIDGTGNFDALEAPQLTPPDGWRAYPARRYNVDGPQDPNQISMLPPGTPRRIAYSMVFVPEKIHATLPPFELSYFSPAQKKYVTVRSAPVSLNMRPGTAPPAESPNGAAASIEPPKPPPVLQPKPQLNDIIVRVPEQPRWLATAPVDSLLASQRFWAAQAVPVGVLLLAALAAWIRKRRAETTQGRRGELLMLWRGLEEGGLPDTTFLQRAAHFIQRALDGKTPRDEAVRQILSRYETRNFTGSENAQPLTATERRDMLGTLRALFQAAAVIAMLIAAAPLHAEDAATLYKQARESIEKGEFTKAQYFAERLTRADPPQLGADVFAIIGHARYRQDDLGRAALWYQRALLLAPRDPELRQNLRHLDDKLRFFVMPATSMLGVCSLCLPGNTWILIAAGGAWLVVLAIAARIWIGKKSPLNASARLWTLVMFILGLLALIPSITFAATRPEPEDRVRDISVVTAAETSLYAAATTTSAANLELPPGSQVRVLEKRGAWSYVEVPTTAEEPTRGWVESSVMQPLWPWDEKLLP
ncbi:MAG: BatD family protein [Verrucomicrobiaceae bacterium]|nr:BatD family protein [Verrucomicrobiaceae bacterium]